MSPYSQTPAGADVLGTMNQSYVSPSVDIPRQKVAPGFGAAVAGSTTPTSGMPPQTPFPVVGAGVAGGGGGGGSFADQQQAYFQYQSQVQGQGQMRPQQYQQQQSQQPQQEKDIVVSIGLVDEIKKVYPMDYFTLDVFVFNRSDWTRRFEIGYPIRARKLGKEKGIVPMENRIRIGYAVSLYIP
jgi:hypothetical protein